MIHINKKKYDFHPKHIEIQKPIVHISRLIHVHRINNWTG